MEIARQIQELLADSTADVGGSVQHLADALAAQAGHLPSFQLSEPAYAAEAPVLDPNTKYLYGVDGNVLIDPMNNKPITDDWWNGFIGFQSNLIKELDEKLRGMGVQEAFGWTIVLYTVLVKLLFYPIQQSQLKSTAMMQLLQPKVKEVQERYSNDPETMNRLIGQLYTTMDVNPLGGCLPLFLQLPLFWSLYGVWRRLSAENFQYYSESWLWVPSLAKPNPDFQFKLDWMWQFENGAPVMGWHDYGCYLIFPIMLVAFTIISQRQATAKTSSDNEQQNLVLQILPYISIYFIGTLSLELPQAVSVYYATNTGLTLAQTALTKYLLRQEIPGYEEYERTGKFPESAFADAANAKAPPPTTLHEAAVRNSMDILVNFYEEQGQPDVNAADGKGITPIGYAVACGNLEMTKFFIEKGASLEALDGQKNTLLHYAAGYGHKAMLEFLLEEGESIWPNNSWAECKNLKEQSVVDAARANRKGAILDFLSERLKLGATGTEGSAAAMEALKARAALVSTQEKEKESKEAVEATVVDATPSAAAPAAVPGMPADSKTANAMAAAVSRLKENPESVAQAKKMMSKMPPQLLSMLSGGKMSTEQAQKAMDKINDMSTEDLLKQTDAASEMLKNAGATTPPGPAPGPATGEAAKVPARAVD